MVASSVEQLLALWSGQGDDAASARTYRRVRAAIEASAALRGRSVEVYLQGSYANTTNISHDSDVDIVVQSSASFVLGYDTGLSLRDRQAVADSFPSAEYKYGSFRDDVRQALRVAFGNRVHEGNKALKVDAALGHVNADVVPAFDYRLYTGMQSFVAGMAFYDRSGEMFVNFPKQHRTNGEAKNERCNGNFKPTVRILKNLRNALYDSGALPDKSIPSYYVECLVANASDLKFQSSNLRQRVDDVVTDLMAALLLHRQGVGTPMCLNGVIPLFGHGNTQWNAEDAWRFVDAAWSWLAQA